MHNKILFLFLFIITGAGSNATAGSEIFGGWEGDYTGQGYGFVTFGVSSKFSGASSLIAKVTPSYLYYEYLHSDSITNVSSPGVSIVTGFNYTAGRTSFTISAGPEFRQNNEKSRIRNRPFTITSEEFVLSAVGQFYLSATLAQRTWVTFLANYDGANKYIFTRMSIEQRIGQNMTAVGLEGTAHGNDDSKSFQAGAFIVIPNALNRMSLRISTGVKNTSFSENTNRISLFTGVGFYRQL